MKGNTPKYFDNFLERMGNNHNHFTKAHLKLKNQQNRDHQVWNLLHN